MRQNRAGNILHAFYADLSRDLCHVIYSQSSLVRVDIYHGDFDGDKPMRYLHGGSLTPLKWSVEFGIMWRCRTFSKFSN